MVGHGVPGARQGDVLCDGPLRPIGEELVAPVAVLARLSVEVATANTVVARRTRAGPSSLGPAPRACLPS